MALEDREDLDLVLHDAIDQPISSLDDLPNIIASELGYPTPGHGQGAGTFRGQGEFVDPAASGHWLVACNEVADLFQMAIARSVQTIVFEVTRDARRSALASEP
ncbi:MAG: hypothetical protein AAGF11_45160 [Myxococcota bacterium]